jgi:hypothetical protein
MAVDVGVIAEVMRGICAEIDATLFGGKGK